MPENNKGTTSNAPASQTQSRGFWRTLLVFFALIGPGIITSNVDNDAGGITTYSLAGSEYGLTLLWTLIPITLALIIIQEMCARMGVVSGKGLSDLIRERFGARVTFYLMIALFLTNLGNTISEFAGVAASLEIFGISKYISVPISAFFVWWLVVKGNYKSVEKVFLVACVFYIAYIISGFMAKPNWAEIQDAFLTPTVSFDPGFLTMTVGIVGTTIAPWMQFYLQSSVVDKGLEGRRLPVCPHGCNLRFHHRQHRRLFHHPALRRDDFPGGRKDHLRQGCRPGPGPSGRQILHLALRLRSPECLPFCRLDPPSLHRLYHLRGLRVGSERQPQIRRGAPVLRSVFPHDSFWAWR